MATELKNLSQSATPIPSGEHFKIGIIVSEWNIEITGALLEGTKQTLIENKVSSSNIFIKWVPGSFELCLGAQLLLENVKLDAVICLGCVIQGETKHFDFICDAVAHGITDLNMKYSKPIVFGVLTTNNLQQAQDRSGGKHGNKGVEAAVTALKMAELKHSFSIQKNKLGF